MIRQVFECSETCLVHVSPCSGISTDTASIHTELEVMRARGAGNTDRRAELLKDQAFNARLRELQCSLGGAGDGGDFARWGRAVAGLVCTACQIC